MVWFKVDDSFAGHPKAAGLSNDALALWTRAGNWSGWQLTDGAVPAEMLAGLAGDTPDPELIARDLVRRRLWEPAEDGWQFHDWLDYNPSREQVLARRKADAERHRRWLQRRRDPGSGRAVSHAVPHAVSHDVSNAVTDEHDETGDHDEPDPDHAVTHDVTHGVTHAVGNAMGNTTPTRPDPTGSGSGRVQDVSGRNAGAQAASGAPARRGTANPTRTARDVAAAARREGGPAADPHGAAAAARRQLAQRPRPLDDDSPPPDEPGGGELHGEDLAAAQVASSRAARAAAEGTDDPDAINPDDYPF